MVKLARIKLPRNDQRISTSIGEGIVFRIETEICLTLFRVRSVTLETEVGKYGTDVTMKIDWLPRPARDGNHHDNQRWKDSRHA